jgi:two-component system sensor histidine kinase DegS
VTYERTALGVHERMYRRPSGLQLSDQDLLVMREERHRLVRELCDGPLERLTDLGLRLDLCRELLSASESAALADELGQLRVDLTKVVTGIRELMAELRCPSFEGLGIAGIIGTYARDYEERAGIRISTDLAQLGDGALDMEQKLAVFRIVQEALRNIRRHSGASRVVIRGEQDGSQIEMVVEDDGSGFNVLGVTSDYPRRGMGLAGMRERAKAIGGEVGIDSQPGQGTRITLTVPMQPSGA